MENRKYPDFISDFSDYLIAIKNYSNNYITSIVNTLQQFLTFINVHKYNNKYKDIQNITLNEVRFLSNSDIYSFIYFLAESHYKIGSRIVKIEHLRTFFDFLYRIQHHIFNQPFKKIKNEKNIYTKLPNYLSLNESQKLLKLYANSTKFTEIRNNAMLHIFLNCGLRISELANLNISDFNFEKNTFVILGKGNKERVGYLNKSTKEALLQYLEVREKIATISPKDSKAVFLNADKQRISTRGIRKIIKLSYQTLGFNTDMYSVHTLRHTCATLMYRNGTDIKTIKELLGHVQIDTTEIYTHLHNKAVMEAMQSHPLSKFKIADALAFGAVA